MKVSDKGGGDFEQAPVGTHLARCVSMIDIGTQSGEYQGKPTAKRKVIFGWELPNELMTTGTFAGKPFVVSKFYMQSLSEKAILRKDLKSWRGVDFTPEQLQGFELKNVLDKGCMVSIVMNERDKANVEAVMGLPKGTQLPPRVAPLVFFSLEPDEFDMAVYDKLSDGIKKLIDASPEMKQLKNPSKSMAEPESDFGAGAGLMFDDDIPFN